MFKRFYIPAIVLCAIASMVQGCSKNSAQAVTASNDAVSVSDNGDSVRFGPNAPQLQQFKVSTVRETTLTLDVAAPAHNLVSVVKSEADGKKLDLFETQDLTDTYSGYITALANVQHASLALQRARDLYAHGIAAKRDLQDAEQDYTTQQAALADNDAKLRAAGIDPHELEQAPVGTVWVIADVPEEQITSITPGMRVDIEYISYPGKIFSGKLSSIGQAIDPTTRKFKVRIELSNPNGELHSAMFGTAHFSGTTQRAVILPATAVVREGDGTLSAWSTTDGHLFTRHTVTVGLQEDTNDQITAGLEPGERVVITGGVFLSNMNESQEPD